MNATENELQRVAAMKRSDLVGRWSELFDSPPPRKVSIEFLRMAIAWRLQAREHPAAVARLRRRMTQMSKTLSHGRKPRVLTAGPRANAGATLLRTWHGKDYIVMVVDGGFLFEGTRYASLSEIARKITGTRWNGPSFFGLRREKAKTQPTGDADE